MAIIPVLGKCCTSAIFTAAPETLALVLFVVSGRRG